MLDLHPMWMVFVAMVFLILLKFLNETLYGPLLTFMDNRKRSIANDLENANSNSADVDSYKEEADRIIAEAKKEASKIREVAIEQAKSVASNESDKKRVELEKEYENFISDLDVKKSEIKNSLMANLPLYKEGIKIKLSQL